MTDSVDKSPEGVRERVVAVPASTRPAAGRIRTYESSQLFGPSTEIGIEHEGAFYRLKITRQGKLILNK